MPGEKPHQKKAVKSKFYKPFKAQICPTKTQSFQKPPKRFKPQCKSKQKRR